MQPNNMFQPTMPPGSAGSPMPMQPVTASQIKKRHSGLVLILALVVFILLFIGSTIFAVWAFAGRQQYKNDVDGIVAKEVEIAKKQTISEQEKIFLEREKEPLKEYKGPDDFGGISIKYPKTWSAYVDQLNNGPIPIDGIFHPNFVPGLNSGTAFAVRVQIVEEDYAQALKKYEPLAKQGSVTVSPVSAVNVPDADVGTRIDGAIAANKKGSVVMFPIRDKTLILTNESAEFANDFNNYILGNLRFSP